MGREATATCKWRDTEDEFKVLLETNEILLRGKSRHRFDRASIEDFHQDKGDLKLTVAGEPLVLRLGEKEAAAWFAKLQKPLPTLAEKLGITPEHMAFVLGVVDDAALAKALDENVTTDLSQAATVIAILRDQADFDKAIAVTQNHPEKALWCVFGKGKFSTLPDSHIRSTLRSIGFMDNKTTGISDQWTATRYRQKLS